MTTYFATLDSPVGELLLMSNGEALVGLHMELQRYPVQRDPSWRRDDRALQPVRRQLEAYFAGELTDFDVPLAAAGTPFQRRVWEELRRIPYGETWSYGELARRLGDPKACRAVGLANGRNPIGIVVPCHRVIGANGALTGYGGGIERKRWLLAHELRVRQGV
jgi:methylated-DNA-[protein]-cysteine S-methyltransferase